MNKGSNLTQATILKKMEGRLNKLARLWGLTLDDRILVANAILMQAIAYHFSVSYVPASLLNRMTARVRALIRRQRVD